MGVTNDYGGQHQVSWYHVDCLLKLSIAKSCSPQNTAGFDSLQSVDQDVFVRKFTLIDDEDELELGAIVKRPKKAQFPTYINVDSAAPALPVPEEKSEVPSPAEAESKPGLAISAKAQSYLDRLVARAEERKQAASEPKPKRKRKYVKPADWTGYTPQQYTSYKKLCETLGTKNIEELKEMCKKNDQKVSGSKLDLIERVADGKVLGKIPKCKTCSKAVLRFNPRTNKYICPGYMVHSDYTQCGKIFSASEVERTQWTE